MKALQRPHRILQVMATGWLLSACTAPALRPDQGTGTVIAARVASSPVAAKGSPVGSSAGALVLPARTPDDVIRAASVASPYRIPEQAAMGTIRYRIEMRDGVAWPWPETGEQHVEHDGDAVVLTICKTCGREAVPDSAELQRDLQPNHWADNGDGVIRMFDSDVRGANVDRSMRLLVLAVRQHMSGVIDFGQYLTSRDAYDGQKGDCTELALLLAAAAKARHIPARVVFGMAYASRFLGQKRVFGPHMWVQAWDGNRWTSYDAGLGEFDATHIVLAVGDGRPDNVPPVFAKLQDVHIQSAQGVLPALAAGH